MNFSQINVLVAIADTGSLTGAAERLSLSQSGVSQAMAALEEDLGVQLFTRGAAALLPQRWERKSFTRRGRSS